MGIKVNGYTFRGSHSFIYIFASHFIRDQFLKKTICSYGSKLFSLRLDPILKVLHRLEKQTGSHKNCLPLKTWRKKMHVYLYSSNCISMYMYQLHSVGNLLEI